MDEKEKSKEQEAAVPETEQKDAPGKKRIPLMAIYVVVAIVIAAAGYFGGMKFMHSTNSDVQTKDTEKSHKQEKDSKKSVVAKNIETFMVEDIIINPSGTGGTRYLTASIGFELGSKETLERFEKRMPLIRDALITILGSKTIEQLSDSKEKEITRFQIKKRVEQLMGANDLEAVYFTNFILQ